MLRRDHLSVLCQHCREAIPLCCNRIRAKMTMLAPGTIEVTCPFCEKSAEYNEDEVEMRQFGLKPVKREASDDFSHAA